MHTKSIKQSLQLFVTLLLLLLANTGNVWGQTNISYAIENPSFEDANLITNHKSAWDQVGQTYANCTGWKTFEYDNVEMSNDNDDVFFIQSLSPAKKLGISKSDYASLGIDGDYVGYYEREVWSWSGLHGIKQLVSNLPAGTYTLTAVMGAPLGSAGGNWFTKLGVDVGATMTTTDICTYYDERQVDEAYVGRIHSVTFTLTSTSSITITACIRSDFNALEATRFWIDNVQLFSYGSDVTNGKFVNPSFNSAYVQPVVATETNKKKVTGWEVTSTDNTYVYYGVIGSSNYNGYSKLKNVAAQDGDDKVMFVRHGEANNSSTLSYTSIGTGDSYPTNKGFYQQATVKLKTVASGLTPGNYMCTAKVKLADYGGAQARVGMSATPQYGHGGNTGLLWSKTSYFNQHIWQKDYALYTSGDYGFDYGVYNGYWNYDMDGETGKAITSSPKAWQDVSVNFEVLRTGDVEIEITLDFPAGDSFERIRYRLKGAFDYTEIEAGKAYVCGTEALIDNITISTLTPWVKPGDYYLYNEDTGMYLGTHAGAAWGSQTMCDTGGMEVTLASRTDATATIDTKMANGSNRYLYVTGSDIYSDGASSQRLTVQTQGSGELVTLKQNDKYVTAQANGVLAATDVATDASLWRLKTYAQRVRELQEMEAGDAAVDATFLIQNPDFGRYDTRWSNWVTEANGSTQIYGEYNNNSLANGASEYRRGGNVNNYIVENWHHAPHVYQGITSRDANVPLPAGIYTLTAQGFDGEDGTTSQLYLRDENNADVTTESADFPRLSSLGQTFENGAFVNGTISDWFTADRTRAEMEIEAYVFGSSGTTAQEKGAGYNYPASFTVGVQNTGYDQWTVFDNFHLTYRPFSAADVTAESNALSAKKNNLVNLGTEAFQVNVETEPHIVALNNAIAAASAGTTKDDFRDNVLSLKRAQAAFEVGLSNLVVNEPDIAKYYCIKNVSDTYGKKNNALTFKAKQNANLEANTTAMGWSEAEGSIYPQTVTFTKIPDVNCTSNVGTAQAAWTGASGTCTINGISMAELYNSSSAGVKMSQEITGLTPGLYRAELYATSHNARGEDGALLSGERSGVAYVFATGNGNTRKTYFIARGVEPNGVTGEPETPVIEDIEVGADGKLTLGLGLESSNLTGWHAIQIKSLQKVSYSDYTLSYTRADGNVVYVGTGATTGLGTTTSELRPTTTAGKALSVRIDSQSNNDGEWWLRNTECSNMRIGANGTNDEGFFTGEVNGYSYYDMHLAELTAKPSVTNTVYGAYHFGTLIVPFDCPVPDNVEAYQITGVDGRKAVLSRRYELKSNTPYILWIESNSNVQSTMQGFGAAYYDPDHEGITTTNMTGSYFDNQVQIPTGDYFLSAKVYNKGTENEETRVALYRVVESVPRWLRANSAYFTPPSSGVREEAYFFSWFDEVDSVDDLLPVGNVELLGVYDASGKQLPRLQKGLNILKMADGTTRKIMVK